MYFTKSCTSCNTDEEWASIKKCVGKVANTTIRKEKRQRENEVSEYEMKKPKYFLKEKKWYLSITYRQSIKQK